MNFDNFTPMSDEELNAQNPQIAEGRIKFRIESSVNKISSTGNPMKEIGLLISDTKGATKEITEKLPLTSKTMWRVKQFCQSIGRVDLYKNGSIPDRDILGLAGEADAKYEDYIDKQGNTKKALRIVLWHEKVNSKTEIPFVEDTLPDRF